MSAPNAETAAGPLATDLEARLAAVLKVDPSSRELTLIDARVAATVAYSGGHGTPMHRRRRRIPRAAVLIAAALLTAGAGTSLVSLYGGIGGGGYRVAWDRATKFGLAQEDAGYRVTLEGAFADAARTMLAISVEDTKMGRSSQVDLRSARLTDDAGHTYEMEEGGSTPADEFRSANIVWYTTPGQGKLSGTQHVHLAVSDIGVRDVAPSFSVLPDGRLTGDPWHVVAGRWAFEFDLPIVPGVRLAPNKSATANGITVTVDSILVTPTTARVALRYAGLPPGDSQWTAVTSVRHGRDNLPVGIARSTTGSTSDEVMDTTVGSDSASGLWDVRITELVGDSARGQIRLRGDWDIRFSAP